MDIRYQQGSFLVDSSHPYKNSLQMADTSLNPVAHPAALSQVEPGRGCLLQIYPATPSSQLLNLTSSRTVIGRDPACDIVVRDNSMSRTHVAIDLLSSGYVLSDLNSTNGTYVDDQLSRGRMPLHGGEQIRMGGCILKFMSGQDEEANYHAVVHELMIRDSLTNAFNRSYLLPLIEAELDNCRQQPCSLSVVLLDIDCFKRINDQHGHLVGDEVLRIFCERIRGELRKSDRLARFGGEEFVISCPQTELQDAVRLAERVRLSIASDPFRTQAGLVDVTCSLGVASSDGLTLTTCDQLVSAADTQLYIAKANGRNQVRTHDTGTPQMIDG